METAATPQAPAAPGLRRARLQALSGLAFGAFLAAHLATTLAAAFGPETFTSVQHTLRRLYQWPVLEIALVLALLVHVGAGLAGWRGLSAGTGRRRRLHRASAVLLLLFVFGHMAATRGVTLWSGADAGFGAVSFSLHWLPAWFVPYYLVLGAAGLYHGWYGALTALQRLGGTGAGRLRASKGFWWPVALGIPALALALAGFGGWLYAIPDPFHNDFARAYLELFGRN